MTCPICNSTETEKEISGILNYYKCGICDVSFNTRKEKQIYNPKITLMQKLIWNIPYSYYNSERLDFIKQLEKGKVLDIGSGNGKFLYMLKLKGWETQGVEPIKNYAEFASKSLGIKTFNEFFEDFETDEKFDLITLLFTIDHTNDPLCVFEKIHSMLKSGGHLFIASPFAVYHEQHNFIFTEKTFDFLLEKFSFVKIKSEINYKPVRNLFILAQNK